MTHRVLLVGLEPGVVDFTDPAYAAFPGLNEGRLRTALEKDRLALVEMGYDAKYSFWDNSDLSVNKFVEALLTHKPDCVMIGAGVRFNPKFTVLFERLVALVRANGPEAVLCFNSGPYDTAEAVQRALGHTSEVKS